MRTFLGNRVAQTVGSKLLLDKGTFAPPQLFGSNLKTWVASRYVFGKNVALPANGTVVGAGANLIMNMATGLADFYNAASGSGSNVTFNTSERSLNVLSGGGIYDKRPASSYPIKNVKIATFGVRYKYTSGGSPQIIVNHADNAGNMRFGLYQFAGAFFPLVRPLDGGTAYGSAITLPTPSGSQFSVVCHVDLNTGEIWTNINGNEYYSNMGITTLTFANTNATINQVFESTNFIVGSFTEFFQATGQALTAKDRQRLVNYLMTL